MGLLRPRVAIYQADPTKDGYGVAFARRDNVGTEYHGSQKSMQARCKEFARGCGFQLVVQRFNSKSNGGGNAKYVFKKLNGQQFFDKDAPEPFSTNGSECDGFWKVSRANFCQDHITYVGVLGRPVAEGTIPRPLNHNRNMARCIKECRTLVETEMRASYEGKIDRRIGKPYWSSWLKRYPGFAFGSISDQTGYRRWQSFLTLGQLPHENLPARKRVQSGDWGKWAMGCSSKHVLFLPPGSGLPRWHVAGLVLTGII
ncbi:hypothetical protein ON010_g11193 [Phytophthora cinnamomi]|nr:hypothetical protein ON010_g11193 [Phytophthora cinnamomi]